VRGGALALPVVIASAAWAHPQGLLVDHSPPACFLAEKTSFVVACLTPRSARADVRVLFRADDGPWYATALRYEMPCYRGVLPRPSAGTPRITYVVEAQAAGVTARSAEQQVAVATACAGAAPIAAGQRAAWDVPAGAPRTPPGFEGSRARPASQAVVDAPRPTPPKTVAATPRAPERVPAPAPPPVAAKPEGGSGGHGLRNAAIVLAGAAAAGGAAVVVRSRDDPGAPATTLGAGLPASGIAGTYVGTESITYSGSCTATDDIVLNLQQSASALSGILTFTVRSCPCCAAGRGANPVSGVVSDTRIELTTPVGFGYSGSFAGNRLSGSLVGPGGITGTWTVDKR
jgi:hypothetical protein